MTVADKPVPSPCNSVCTMDPARGWCAGCLRTLDEIAAWSTLDDTAKRGVWQQLADRRGQLRRAKVAAVDRDSQAPEAA